MNERLALKIKELITEKNISVQGLEKKAGLKINAVRNILTGHSKKPSAENLLAVAKALNCSISELLEEERPESKEAQLKDMEFSNHKLLREITQYVIHYYEEKNAKLGTYTFISTIQDIYTYSCDNNNEHFDEKFALWLLAKHFE